MDRYPKIRRRPAVLVALVGMALFAFTGCYHATVTTELAPSPQTYTDSFASSWVYGLVPPDTVDAAEHCPNGVARVETKLSFVNQLVGVLTLGIYTPMYIEVTCAQGGTAGVLPYPNLIKVPEGATPAILVDRFSRAADRAVEQQEAVYERFEYNQLRCK